jgi:uncharacterized protein (TIGR02271 family)
VTISSTGPDDGGPGQERPTDQELDISGSEREGPKDKESGGSFAEEREDDAKLQLLAEEVSFAKETLETGRVRISKRTQERDELIDEGLTSESVEIETMPIGRQVFEMPTIRHEGDTTIIPVVEEVLFTERRLILKEEIRIKRIRTIQRYQDRVTLRHQEAVITRIHGGTEEADTVSENDTKPTNVEE